MITFAGLNAFGLYIAKLRSSVARSTVDAARASLVWVYFLIFTGTGHE
jgi:hypothetical protein